MKIKAFLILLLTIICASCTSNRYLHKSITPENFHLLMECKELNKGDSIWLNKKSVCVNEAGGYLKVGDIRNGKEKGKWYYYYSPNDTIHCTYIKRFRKNYTLLRHHLLINPRYW